ncbi:MAG: acetylhydrolase [Prolixibacteraceae bacterium]|jgi:lysophospholipase L1-like esterase|nr:acetylhydrolase [Prolixibacteraceae bacterium]MBT6763060.1 acetylhydrolase [Prolixibacteraceae bacterium]MBT6998707.1 acetylhydrolase [Prolixibacteraceae bacterium]MBT7397508.1 acetylhydrolase [Prolixibacteraceae bacterium]
MKIKLYLLLVVILTVSQITFSQEKTNISWWNPAESKIAVIDGQGWPNEVQSSYDRLPERAEKTVRKPVWNLSKQSAGLKIRFRSNAEEVKVRYKVNGNFAKPHMPATGVSGVDLYAKDSDGKWMWCKGNYSFGDTVTYNFKNITANDKYHELGREYHLYLPLYNSVEWLKIGVAGDAHFEPLPTRKEKPIVVYGTSIAQGACASRPGMAWTSILERKMDRPLINLGFSGNGRLETELIDLLSEIDAKIYILDCLPNLALNENRSAGNVHQLIISSVKRLRKNSSVPILLVEHAGYSDGTSSIKRYNAFNDLNKIMKTTFAQLKSEGITNIFLLTEPEIGMSLESYVEGTHPSDLGMTYLATAYEKKIRQILDEPVGVYSTTIPVTQAREPGLYNWEKRHNKLLELNKNRPAKICYFGNSITHYWGGIPKAPQSNGTDSWDKFLGDLNVQNFGFGWDRVENVLWRIYHDELDGFNAEQIVVNLGTNNLHLNTNEEIISGLKLVIQSIKNRQPHAKILMIALYPRRDYEKRIYEINLDIAQLAGMENISFIDPGSVLLDINGNIDESLFLDGLHPNSNGYNILAPEIRKELTK